jgi:hypothetical protein
MFWQDRVTNIALYDGKHSEPMPTTVKRKILGLSSLYSKNEFVSPFPGSAIYSRSKDSRDRSSHTRRVEIFHKNKERRKVKAM